MCGPQFAVVDHNQQLAPVLHEVFGHLVAHHGAGDAGDNKIFGTYDAGLL